MRRTKTGQFAPAAADPQPSPAKLRAALDTALATAAVHHARALSAALTRWRAATPDAAFAAGAGAATAAAVTPVRARRERPLGPTAADRRCRLVRAEQV